MSDAANGSSSGGTAALVRRAVGAAGERLRLARLPDLGSAPRDDQRPRRAAIFLGGFAAVLLAAIVAAKVLLPHGLPNGIIVLGLVLGGLNALPALAIVLVYRANRIVNFSQGELGAFAASLAYLLIVTLGWSWYLAVPLSLVAAGVVGGLIEFGIMRRFFRAPRLIMTVATIGVAQLLSGLRLGLPNFFPDVPGFAGTFPSEFSTRAFELSGAIFAWDHVLIIVAVPVATVGLTLFLRGSWAGLGTRAAAGNLERSRMLAIPVRRLSTIVWIIAGLLSGLTAIFQAPVAGFSLINASGIGLLTRILTPAAIGGFSSLPITFAAALVLGVVEQTFFWNYARGGPMEMINLVVLLVALLVRSRRSRAFDTSDTTMSWSDVREMARVPKRIRERREVRLAGLLAGFVALQFLLAAPDLLSPGRVNLLGLMGIQVIVALSLVVLTGWAGQISLGHWALVGVGAFVAGNAAVRWELDFFVTMLLGAIAGGLVSLLLGIPAQRLPGIMFGVTTLAFAAASENWIFQLGWMTRGSSPERPVLFGSIDITSTTAFYFVVLAVTVICSVAVANAKRYRLADVLIASRDNPRAAEAFGISVTAARRLAFFLSGALAGLAGVLYAFQQQVVASNRFAAGLGATVLAIVVIGGLGSISGAVAGAVLIRGAQYLLPSWVYFFTSGVGLVIVLLVFPGGLGEVLFRLRDRFLARFVGERELVDRRDAQADDDVIDAVAERATPPVPVGASS